jgi:DUF2934 family protein
MTPNRQGEIAERAYRIWEGEGRPSGRDIDHWLRAEAEVHAECEKPVAQAPSTSKSERPDIVVAAPVKPQRAAPRRTRRAQ